MKTQTQKTQKLMKVECYREGEILHEMILSKKKMLIGSFEGADLSLQHPHISHYHAFIILDQEGGTLIDLASENGSYINNQRVEKAFFSAGDILRFGALEFHVQEWSDEEKVEVENQDTAVERIDQDQWQKLPSELPPLPGLTVIDGEYCDIVFDDDHFIPLQDNPLANIALAKEEYVDLVKEDEEILPIARQSQEMAIEVTVLSMGVILSVDTYPTKKKGAIFASATTHNSKTVCLNILDASDDLPFIQFQQDQIQVISLPGMSIEHSGKDGVLSSQDQNAVSLKEDDLIILTKGSVQVMIRQIQAPAHLRAAPFFGRDREFQKQTAKIFSAVMGVMLLLLLVDTSIPEPEKEIAVIYREAIKAPTPVETKSSAEVSEKEVDKGVKPTEQSQEPVKMAKKSTPTPTQAQPKQETQAAAPPAPQAPAKAPAVAETKTKTYEFKSKSSLSSLLDKPQNAPQKLAAKESSKTGTTGFQASASASPSELSGQTSQSVGTLGQDFAGDYDSSSGARGLASKRGIDTTYVDPKTVVLGSMDPELLRKILQEYLPQFRHCYQQELERRGDHLRGVIDLNFRIDKNGKVSRMDIKTKEAPLTQEGTGCMKRVLGMIDFPAPKGGGIVDVRQPLNFFSEVSRL